ncbi:sigma-70 family RNA polymerase sigma factor [Niallia taxi]|uniref:sigma-70 family RNA polymerase sigma factor n=1 Tax=Niallia taxi TaxID=2499688 RepID=UPI003F62418F
MENSLLHNWIYCELSHEDLIKQYQETLDSVKKKRKEIKSEINDIKEILKENKSAGKSKRLSKERKTAFVNKWQELEAVDTHYSGIQGDLDHALSWMKNGHAPGVIRGIERRAAYEREKPIDPLIMQRFFRSNNSVFQWDNEPKENVITPSEKIIIEKATKTLTEKEMEVFLMCKGKGMSQYEVARIMNISRNSVKSMLSRANKKVAKILLEEKDVETA